MREPRGAEMADQMGKPGGKEDATIPVFAVLKKGSVLKNIFLNNPPPEFNFATGSPGRSPKGAFQEEEKVLIGRHPDCHIVLDHPSISRFHLEIRVQPSSQKLSVVDLSSVHGTWVSGNKIEPCVPVDLAEGDTVRLGASTRVYELHWVPVSSAFEWDNRLPAVQEEQEQTNQDENCIPAIDYFSFGSWANQIPSAPPMPQSMNSPLPSRVPSIGENQNPGSGAVEEIVISSVPVFEMLSSSFGSWANQIPSAPPMTQPMNSPLPSPVPSIWENQNPGSGAVDEIATSSVPVLEMLSSSSPVEAKENRNPEAEGSPKNPVTPKSEKRVTSSLLSRRSKSINFLRVHTGRSREKLGTPAFDMGKQEENGMVFEQVIREETVCKVLFSALDGEEGVGEETFLSDKENMTPEASGSRKLMKNRMGLQRSALNVHAALDEKEDGFFSDKENCTPQVPQAIRQVCKGAENSIKSGRQEDAFLSDKENCTPQVAQAIRQVCKGAENSIKSGRQGEEMYASDKENQTPLASGDQVSKNDLSVNRRRIQGEILRRIVDRIPFQSLFESSVNKNSPSVGRIPFQCLGEKSASKNSATPASASPGNSNLICHSKKSVPKSSNISVSADQVHHKAEEAKKWNIVADTSCFLNEESRKSLQLLEGLRGTYLIVPRMVIRELDCLRRHEGLFRKTSKASSALQWIEACMVKTSWWIHVQSSMESMPVAPTPPASPQVQLCEDSNGFHGFISNSKPFSTCGSLAEILSPTAEDHILDSALLFKKIKNDRKLVLLTNEISLKIKAMAEGLLCESPKEFRDSLVNPFSQRFLWAESSPRGPTWSCSDQVSQHGNYHNHCPIMKKTSKAAEGAKGLKLILLHNSHYAQANIVK